jgi:Tfp pilus assembly protein PilO
MFMTNNMYLQNSIIMALGIIAMTGCAGYIIYMRSKYQSMGFYSAIESDGTETFKKKVSKWTV